MHFWAAPGPELIRVYAYLASRGFPLVACALWNGLMNGHTPMVRSSPKGESPQLRMVELCATGGLCLPAERGLGNAFTGIAFAGVHQRSPQFSWSLNSHEHPFIFGHPLWVSFPFAVGWLGAARRQAQASVRVIVEPAVRVIWPTAWRCPGLGAAGDFRARGNGRQAPWRWTGPGDCRRASRAPEGPERRGTPDAGRSGWGKPERPVCGSGVDRSARSPQARTAGVWPAAGRARILDS